MKYLITESQAKTRAAFLKLDLKNFIQIEKDTNIYFLDSEDDEYAQIRYDKSDGWCYINYDLIKEISSLFSLEDDDSKEVIGEWVENTLQVEVTYTRKVWTYIKTMLRIPFK